MLIIQKHLNNCTLYLFLWILYILQGSLYDSGSIISRGLLTIILLISLYYTGKVNNSNQKKPFFLKVLNVFLIMISIYGIDALLNPTAFVFSDYTTAPKFEYIKTAYMSLLPIYVFYYFIKQGELNEKTIRFISLLLLVVITISYYERQNQATMAMIVGRSNVEITNNVAYDFLHLLPMAFFWDKKTLIQYLFVVYIIIFLILGMKRGALLIGVVCLSFFIYRSWKLARVKQRILILFLIGLIINIGLKYFFEFYASSDYFQYRIQQTLDGDSSGRDGLYIALWNHFLNDTTFVNFVFGNGAMQTIKIAGNYAHNDWLEILICQGIVGVIIYLLYFVFLLRCWLQSRNNIIVYSMFGMILLIMFASSIFSMSYNNLSLAITLCLGYCLVKYNEK